MGKSATEVLKMVLDTTKSTMHICLDSDCRVDLFCYKTELWQLRKVPDALTPLYEAIEKYDAPLPTEVTYAEARFQLLHDGELVGDPVKAAVIVTRWAEPMSASEKEALKLAIKATATKMRVEERATLSGYMIEVLIPLQTAELETLLKRAQETYA